MDESEAFCELMRTEVAPLGVDLTSFWNGVAVGWQRAIVYVRYVPSPSRGPSDAPLFREDREYDL